MIDFIEAFPHALDTATCKGLIAAFERSPNVHASTVFQNNATVAQQIRKSDEMGLSPATCGAQCYASLDNAYKKAYASYIKKFPILQRYTEITSEPYNLLCYHDERDHYGSHADATGPGVRYRFVSGICYLNTVKKGGETEFQYQKKAIHPKEGMIVFFPSGWPWLHQGLCPKTGPKYIVTTWLRFADFPPL